MAGVRSQPRAIAACGRRGPPRQAKQSRHALGGARLPLLPPRWAWLCAAARQGRRLRGRAAAHAGVALYRQRQRVYTQQV